MDLVTKLNDRSLWRKYGVVLNLIRKFFWIQKVNFYSLELTEWKQMPMPKMRLSVVFSFGDESAVVKMVGDRHLDARSAEKDGFLRKLNTGDRLLLGKLREEIVFYFWVVSRRKELMDKILILNPDEIVIERGFTRKEYRGHGLFVYGLNFLIPRLIDEGNNRLLTDIATHNNPMMQTILKCGFRQTDSYYLWLRHRFGHYAFPKGAYAGRCVTKMHG